MKKKSGKKLGIVLVMVLVLQLLFTGCGKEKITPANEIASGMYKLILQQDDKEALEVIGMSAEEVKTLTDTLKDATIAQLKSSLTLPGYYEATDEDVQGLYQAQIDAYKRLNFTAEVTTEEKDKATVMIKTDYYSIGELTEQAINKLVKDMGDKKITDEKSAKEFIQNCIDKTVEVLNTAEPKTDQKEISVDFEKTQTQAGGKVKTMWMPSNATKMGTDLMGVME